MEKNRHYFRAFANISRHVMSHLCIIKRWVVGLVPVCALVSLLLVFGLKMLKMQNSYSTKHMGEKKV